MSEIKRQIGDEIKFNVELWQKNLDLLECFDVEEFAERIKGSMDTNFIIREFAFMLKDSEGRLKDFFDSYFDMAN